MTFEKVLNEYSFDVPHNVWMNKQKNIWLELVKKHIVSRNDTYQFAKFGKLFDDFYKSKHKFPSLKDVVGALR